MEKYKEAIHLLYETTSESLKSIARHFGLRLLAGTIHQTAFMRLLGTTFQPRIAAIGIRICAF